MNQNPAQLPAATQREVALLALYRLLTEEQRAKVLEVLRG